MEETNNAQNQTEKQQNVAKPVYHQYNNWRTESKLASHSETVLTIVQILIFLLIGFFTILIMLLIIGGSEISGIMTITPMAVLIVAIFLISLLPIFLCIYAFKCIAEISLTLKRIEKQLNEK